MKQYTEVPLFFERNRVYRVYLGGYLFSDLLGDRKEDSNYPEEWIASTVHAINDKSAGEKEGLSVIEGTEVTLRELIEAYPEEMTGTTQGLGILVKYLDSAIRLPLQAHPDQEFSKQYFHSKFGKTEMWLILATRENANICFGFKDKITEEEFSKVIEESRVNKDIMNNYLNRVPVKPGEIYFIPAKAVHAIGEGCLILEVQEPTDFTIQPEYWCGDHLLNDQEMYMGLPKEVALKCFDYSIYGTECLKTSKKEPVLVYDSKEYKKEALISEKDTDCFHVNRYSIATKMVMSENPAIFIVTKGTGVIRGAKYSREIKKGDYFYLPNAARNMYEVIAKEPLELIECYH